MMRMYYEMNQIGVSQLDLENLKAFAERVSGEWNGDQPGTQEDMASVANEIIDTCNTLQGLLTELDTYDYHS